MFTPLVRGTLRPGSAALRPNQDPGGGPIMQKNYSRYFRNNPASGKVPNPRSTSNRVPSSIAMKKNLGAA